LIALSAAEKPREYMIASTQAGKHLPAGSDATSVVADSGVENVNQEVNALFESGPLRRVLAQVEVSFSNSMIEAWWRSLKHGWLYLHQLDTLAALEKLIAFYVEQHNSVVPHAAFAGQTPDEMYFSRGDHVPGELAAGHARARVARLESNRRLSCGACRPSVHDPPGLPDRSAISRVLQLREGMSGMS
jgi:putative transposase